jgi:hypothetical protein
MTVHSDSTSAIARAGHTGAGPGQNAAPSIRNIVCNLWGRDKTVNLVWVKRQEGTPGNEEADALAGRAAEKPGYSRVMSIAHLKLRISEKFRKAKMTWHDVPIHHGAEETRPPPLRSTARTKCEMRLPVQRRRYVPVIGEICSLPQADPKNGGRQMLVLPGPGSHDALPCPAPLLE